ncbi:MAG: putative serine/threonine-protein kinase iks1 [Thelocarpon impressellum]|nr:MAG: putative serine/threonine-protein kinase iks1 [Thelocarpon impressellum]
MAEQRPQQQQTPRDLSLVPYPGRDSHGIILRHNNAVVVYDPTSRQLVLRGTPPSDSVEIADSTCPFCHQHMRTEPPHEREHGRGEAGEGVESDFVSPEYFRRLQNYTPSTEGASSPPSPVRRLAQPIQASVDGIGAAAAAPQSSHGISSEAFLPDYFKRFFVEESVLGKGGKGVVLLVKHYLDGVFLGEFACKRVPVGDDHEWLKKVLVEVVLLQQLSHQNLVSYRHVWLEDIKLTGFGPSVPCAFILQQYCNGGDLLQYILRPAASTTTEQRKNLYRRKSKGKHEPVEELSRVRGLSFDEIYSFFRDITSGLNYLHVKGFIHRDLKPSNCLLHKTGKDVRVLVSDFGEAQEASKARKSTGATGTISYCAPEVLRKESTGGRLGEFTAKSDIFSLGMILYFMCFGRLPYNNANNLNEENEDLEQLREEIAAWHGFDDEARSRTDLPEQLYRFLKRLLSVNPVERPSAEDILRGISGGNGATEGLQSLHTNSGSVFEDLRTGSRISQVDTPPPGTPTGHWHGRKIPPLTRAQTKLRPKGPSQDPREHSPGLHDGVSDDDDDVSTSSSLVLRKSLLSTTSAPSSPHHAHAPALPPPTSASARLGRLLTRPSSTTALHAAAQGVLFIAKVFSMQQSCAPFAVRPLYFNPLLFLAASDLVAVAASGWGRVLTLALAVLHFSVLFLAGRWGVLCLYECRSPSAAA